MLKRERMMRVTALLVFVLVSGLSACTFSQENVRACTCGGPPAIWEGQPNQGIAIGPAGTFALKFIEFTPKQFRFYYVFKTSHQAPLQVTASSAIPANTSMPVIPLATTVQTLGRISEYTIGVIHVQHLNRAGQIIMLAITPALAGAATWRLEPFKQLIMEPHSQTARGGIGVMPVGLPEAQWSGEYQEQLVSYVKVVIPGQPVADRTYVFLRSDDPVVVKVITKAQYIAIAGPANFTP